MTQHSHTENRKTEELFNDPEIKAKYYSSLLYHWIDSYLKNCKTNSTTYRDWNNFYHSKHPSKYSSLSNSAKQFPNNCAYQTMYGFQLFHLKQYSKSIKYLSKGYSKWYNSIILIAISDAFLQLNQFKKSLNICKHLLSKNWLYITKYLCKCCIEPYVLDLNHAVYEIIFKCYWKLLKKNKKSKYIQQFLQYTISFNKVSTYVNPKTPTDQIPIYDQLIRLSFWNNNYDKAIKYALIVFSICKQNNIILQAHSATICYVLLYHAMRKDTYWFNTASEWIIHQKDLCVKSYVETKFTSMVATEFGALLIDKFDIKTKFSYDSIMNYKEYLVATEYHNDTSCITAISIIGDAQHFNLSAITNRDFCFWDKLWIKHSYVIKIEEWEDQNCSALCLSLYFFWYLYGLYHFSYKNDLKKAKYCFKLALIQKPNDPLTLYQYSKIMMVCGRYKYALICLNKSFRLNNKIVEINENIETYQKYLNLMIIQHGEQYLFDDNTMIENGWFNECNWCLTKGNRFRKCSKCKVVYYCCRKCQKSDWNNHHRTLCSFNQKPRAKHKLFYYVCKLKFKLYDNM